MQRAAFGGDVRKAHHEAAVGHFFGKDREDKVRTAVQFEIKRGAGPGPARPMRDGGGCHVSVQRELAAQRLGQGVDRRAQPEAAGRHRQKRGKAVVPAHEPRLGVEDADALADVFKRGPDHPGLVVQKLAAFLPFQPDYVGDIRLQDHGAAVLGPVFGHLNPAVARKLDVEHHMPVLVAAHPRLRPAVGAFARRQRKVARQADHPHIIGEGKTRAQPVADVGQLPAEARIAHHHPVVRIEKRKSFLHRLDRGGEVLARRLRLGGGLREACVGLVQKSQRAFQLAGALADLIFKHRGAFELQIGAPTIIRRLFDPPHENVDDLKQLLSLPLRRVGGIDQRVGHRAASGGG